MRYRFAEVSIPRATYPTDSAGWLDLPDERIIHVFSGMSGQNPAAAYSQEVPIWVLIEAED